MNDLRPTLFLAQLSNLLAGNIAIVHGVSGTSRTFMGEEAAGIDAARIALARIESGQSDIALVGAAHNGERPDLLMLYEFGDFNLTGQVRAGLGARQGTRRLRARFRRRLPGDGIQRARRGARRQALCQAEQGGADLAQRKQPGAVTKSLETLWPKLGISAEDGSLITGATGVEPVTSEEKAFLQPASRFCRARDRHDIRPHDGSPVSARPCAGAHFRSRAARCFRRTIRPDSRLKRPGAPTQIVVVGAGHWQGEGMALVEAVKQ